MTDPFFNRPIEWNELYQPLIGKTMLELGNKFNQVFDCGEKYVYKTWFHSLGIEHVSVDLNGQDGALSKDLRFPLNLGTFDIVTNMGTSEHVEGGLTGQVGVWQNIADAVKLNGVVLSATPKPGHWTDHGQYYPTLGFYSEFARLNGLMIEKLIEFTETSYNGHLLLGFRGRRVEDVPFTMPDFQLMHINETGIMGIAR